MFCAFHFTKARSPRRRRSRCTLRDFGANATLQDVFAHADACTESSGGADVTPPDDTGIAGGGSIRENARRMDAAA
jgi:hypothetical protein